MLSPWLPLSFQLTPLIPTHSSPVWVQPLRLEARVYLEPKRKPFSSGASTWRRTLLRTRGPSDRGRVRGIGPIFLTSSGDCEGELEPCWCSLLCGRSYCANFWHQALPRWEPRVAGMRIVRSRLKSSAPRWWWWHLSVRLACNTLSRIAFLKLHTHSLAVFQSGALRLRAGAAFFALMREVGWWFSPSLWNVGMEISAAAHNGTSVQVQRELPPSNKLYLY